MAVGTGHSAIQIRGKHPLVQATYAAAEGVKFIGVKRTTEITTDATKVHVSPKPQLRSGLRREMGGEYEYMVHLGRQFLPASLGRQFLPDSLGPPVSTS
jgi:hypothetical protein